MGHYDELAAEAAKWKNEETVCGNLMGHTAAEISIWEIEEIEEKRCGAFFFND